MKPLHIFGQAADLDTLAQAQRCLDHPSAIAVALMADNHRGYSVPIGGVVVYDEAVSPAGVGYDIGCGNNALLTDLHIDELGYDTPANGLLDGSHAIRKPNCVMPVIMDEVWRTVNFGMGSKSKLGMDDPIFEDDRWKVTRGVAALKELARTQIGSVGAGNHYVDIFCDEYGRVWIGNHFGSRGFGHKTATGFMNLIQNRAFEERGPGESMDVAPMVVKTNTLLGIEYWTAMELAGEYAMIGRDLVLKQVYDILYRIVKGRISAPDVSSWRTVTYDGVHDQIWHGPAVVRNNHNLAWKERHYNQDVVVVRKGATPAFPGQYGFIGASMAEPAYIVRGVHGSRSPEAFYSTVHGAGRVMSRTAAAGKLDRKTGIRSGGKISGADMMAMVTKANVVLRGGGTDEAPQAYKRLDNVLQAHKGTIEIVHHLFPLGVAMASATEKDDYKD